MGKIRDIVGEKFNKLTVLEFYDNDKSRSKSCRIRWKCICECGQILIAYGFSIKFNRIKSCKKCAYIPHRTAYGETNLNRLYVTYKNAARRRNYVFSLTKDEFRYITGQKCYYCNIEPKQICFGKRTNGAYIYNGIDRLDNEKGYEINNIVSCCGMCNAAKSNHSKEYFEKWIKRVYLNLTKD